MSADAARPVRVGDMVQCGARSPFAPIEGWGPAVRLQEVLERSVGEIQLNTDDWSAVVHIDSKEPIARHADGAPIDVEASLRIARGEMYYIARKRIAKLEASLAHSRECCADRQEWAGKVDERANRMSDEAGALRTELQAVKAENSDLRRTIERLERKGGRR